MNTEKIIAIAHRTAWKYKHSTDPCHSDTYTFNDACLLDFVAKVRAMALDTALHELLGEPVAWKSSRDNGATWLLSDVCDPSEIMPDKGGCIIPLFAPQRNPKPPSTISLVNEKMAWSGFWALTLKERVKAAGIKK